MGRAVARCYRRAVAAGHPAPLGRHRPGTCLHVQPVGMGLPAGKGGWLWLTVIVGRAIGRPGPAMESPAVASSRSSQLAASCGASACSLDLDFEWQRSPRRRKSGDKRCRCSVLEIFHLEGGHCVSMQPGGHSCRGLPLQRLLGRILLSPSSSPLRRGWSLRPQLLPPPQQALLPSGHLA